MTFRVDQNSNLSTDGKDELSFTDKEVEKMVEFVGQSDNYSESMINNLSIAAGVVKEANSSDRSIEDVMIAANSAVPLDKRHHFSDSAIKGLYIMGGLMTKIKSNQLNQNSPSTNEESNKLSKEVRHLSGKRNSFVDSEKNKTVERYL